MNKNIKLAKKYGAKEVKYRDLPKHFQVAIAYYMSIDGDAWEFPNDNWKKHPALSLNRSESNSDKYEKYLMDVVKRNVTKHFAKKYGDKKFGVAEIPTDVIVQRIIEDAYPDPSVKTKEDYIELIKKNGVPNHPKSNRHPAFLSEYDEEIFSDGWHRSGLYIVRGDENIPCVYFP